jgi:hypothetical protein
MLRCSLMVATQSERGALRIDVASRGLVTFEISVDPRDVVFVKGIVEASDGLASIFAEPRARGAAPIGGDLLVACHASRTGELRALLADLGAELGCSVVVDERLDEADRAEADRAGGDPAESREARARAEVDDVR